VNAHQQHVNAHLQEKFHAVEWDILEIHDKFNMWEAMLEYEKGIFHLLELSGGWDWKTSGINAPKRLADLSFLCQSAEKRLQVSNNLALNPSFSEYFDDVDALLDAMGQWSLAFKKPGNNFDHKDHPQSEEMHEILVKIGDQMTTLNLAKLHVKVIEKTFSHLAHLVFVDPSAKNHTNYPPTATNQPSGSDVSKD
jgi:hypothetical protein